MHDRQTEILCTLERIERLLMRLCNNTSKDGFYYVPVSGTVRSADWQKDAANAR